MAILSKENIEKLIYKPYDPLSSNLGQYLKQCYFISLPNDWFKTTTHKSQGKTWYEILGHTIPHNGPEIELDKSEYTTDTVKQIGKSND